MSDIAIRVERLSKRYKIGVAKRRHDSLRDVLGDALNWMAHPRVRKAQAPSLWALRDVSFEVKLGEVLGIIGRNGAGKSTLVKILARITAPTSGWAELSGRVGTLLEVGAGFHAELTGRENIYLSGAILGMRKAEIDRKFDEIVAFSGVERFLDTPVKWYSSGMHVRLAFAVAAHLEAEILLLDEVLAVGDAAFQKKCLGKIGDATKEGRTVLFVSHNMGALSSLCNKAIYLSDGSVKESGPAAEVVRRYLGELFEERTDDLERLRLSGFGKKVRFSDIRLVSENGANLLFGQPIRYSLSVRADVDLEDLSISSGIFDNAGSCVGSLVTKQSFSIEAGQEVALELTLSNVTLAPGSYYCAFGIGHGGWDAPRSDFDVIIGKPVFQVLLIPWDKGAVVHWDPKWGSVVFRDAELRLRAEVRARAD